MVSVNFPPVRETLASPSAMSGTIAKLGLMMYSARSDVPTVHDVQVLLHPSRAPFRHGGSCSAAKMTVPPVFGFCEVPAEPPATNTAATMATTARRAAKPSRCMRCPPFPIYQCRAWHPAICRGFRRDWTCKVRTSGRGARDEEPVSSLLVDRQRQRHWRARWTTHRDSTQGLGR